MKLSKALRDALARIGREGGKAAARSRTPAQRAEIARAAAHARWARTSAEERHEFGLFLADVRRKKRQLRRKHRSP